MGTRGRVLTDVHVNEMLSVLVDRPPHVRLALLVLVSSSGGGRGLLLAGVRVSVRHHGFVRALAVLRVGHVAAVGVVAVFLNHLAECRVNHKATEGNTRTQTLARWVFVVHGALRISLLKLNLRRGAGMKCCEGDGCVSQ